MRKWVGVTFAGGWDQYREILVFYANSVDPGQTSELGLTRPSIFHEILHTYSNIY